MAWYTLDDVGARMDKLLRTVCVFSPCYFCIAMVFEGLSDLSYYRWMDTDSGFFIEGISFYTFTLKNVNCWQWLSSSELHSHHKSPLTNFLQLQGWITMPSSRLVPLVNPILT